MTGPRILLTGATGYIGSHTWLALLEAGFRVVGVDNLSNSSPHVLQRLEMLSGHRPDFFEADVRDKAAMSSILGGEPIAAAIHFAAFKAVGDSVARPLEYFANNVGGLLCLCEAMAKVGCRRLVFSSSATVYGRPEHLPIREDAQLGATNPYGASKLMAETMLGALQSAEAAWSTAILRYFNPAGAHPSGLIGEEPRGIPDNLMPYLADVAMGRRDHLKVFGTDYATADGSGVRDYVHVLDVAEGHVAALVRLLASGQSFVVNLGTGRGHSVLDVVRAFEKASGRIVPLQVAPRRAGDVDSTYADATRAHELLGWQAQRDLEAMCADTWRWRSSNPDGYAGP